VSDVVVLSLRTAPVGALELAGVTPDRLAQLPQREIAALPVRHAGRAAALGDFFSVKGERTARVRLEGDLRLAEGMGAGMTGGELVVEGHAGRDVGVAMTGGAIEGRGDAGDNAGGARSEEHTSELQSQSNLVCRLLLEKKKRQRVHRRN